MRESFNREKKKLKKCVSILEKALELLRGEMDGGVVSDDGMRAPPTATKSVLTHK